MFYGIVLFDFQVGTRKTSIQQKISSFATPIPHAPTLSINDSKNKNSNSKTPDSNDKDKLTATAEIHDAGGKGPIAEKAGGKKVTDTSGGIKFGTLREFLPSSPFHIFTLLGALAGNLVKKKRTLIANSTYYLS
jgi:hypothetical protein